MREPLFIHIPKTGGVSVRQIPWVDSCGHGTALQLRDSIGDARFNAAFKFAFLRDPFERLVSTYHYFYQMTTENRWHKANVYLIELMRQYPSFHEFCSTLLTNGALRYYHLFPQSDWVLVEGRVAVNFLGSTNALQEGMNIVADAIGLPRGHVPQINTSEHGPAMNYYTPETIAITRQAYAADFSLINDTENDASAYTV